MFTRTVFVCTVCFVASVCLAGDWTNWRGPKQTGVAEGDAYPVSWSPTEHVRWKIELPGPGASTPVVIGDQIFVTCGVDGVNHAVSYSREGKQTWKTAIGKERPGKNAKATGANSSPVADSKNLFVYFKSGDLAGLDFTGKIVWQHNLQEMFGEDTLWWDLGTSPVLSENYVIVACMQTGPSYIAAFEKKTGKLAWKQDRNLNAPSEAAQSYSTPIVLADGAKETLIVLGADHVTAHDLISGKELWRVGGLNPTGHQYFRSIASAVSADGIVVAPYARGETLTAIKLGGSGDVTQSNIVWTKKGLGADVPTPALKDGKLYVCTDKGTVACLDLQSGSEIWSGQLEKHRQQYSSCPIIAGNKLYVTREDGTTYVLALDEFKVLSSNTVKELTVATPVFVDGEILIRTRDHLFCIKG